MFTNISDRIVNLKPLSPSISPPPALGRWLDAPGAHGSRGSPLCLQPPGSAADPFLEATRREGVEVDPVGGARASFGGLKDRAGVGLCGLMSVRVGVYGCGCECGCGRVGGGGV